MEISKETIIGELVAKDYRTASVFEKNDLDFCCNGAKSIGEACDKLQVSTDKVIQELNDVLTQKAENSNDYNSWPLDLLADYIQKKHHRYVEARIPEIKPLLAKINQVHGGRHPELARVEQLFNEAAGEMAMHMKKEELMLFPKIRKMEEAKQNGSAMGGMPLEGSIKTLMMEHDDQGDKFHEIKHLTNNYTSPADGCNTYRVTLALLKEFEDDLHLHIHLENNILFPKSIKLEEELAVVQQS